MRLKVMLKANINKPVVNSNFCVKCDNTPADYGVFFEFAESISGFILLWGVTPYANS